MGFNLMIAGRLETQKVTIMCVSSKAPIWSKSQDISAFRAVGLGVLLRGRVQFGPQSALGLISMY